MPWLLSTAVPGPPHDYTRSRQLHAIQHYLESATWEQLLQPGPFLLAGDQQIPVSCQQEHSLLNSGQHALDNSVPLLQQLQFPLQHRWRENLGQVSQLRYQLL